MTAVDGPPLPPQGARPGPAARACDPIAAALGNASLLGVGYLLLRRRLLAVLAVAVTITLGVILATRVRESWLEGVVLLWWVAVTAHGWYLARRRQRRTEPQAASAAATDTALRHPPPNPASRQRLAAAAVTVPVLLAVSTFRFDAGHIVATARDAHRDGECQRALSLLNGLPTAHRVANAPLTARTEAEAEACRILLQAKREAVSDPRRAVGMLERYADHPAALWQRADLLLTQAAIELDIALTGDVSALMTGYERLNDVIKQFPGREQDAGKALDRLLDRLPAGDACKTADITNWLHARHPTGNVLDQVRSRASTIAPTALAECGKALMDDERWHDARSYYRILISDHPEHELVAAAKSGVRKADLAIQLADVKKLLKPGESRLPAYCSRPTWYEGAPRYRGKGPHRALLFGQDGHKSKLPSSWLTSDPAKATLVICAGKSAYGTRVRTCYYQPRFSNSIYPVTFYKRKIPIRVYELRTGKLVKKTSLQIGGRSCPQRIYYSSRYLGDAPPSKRYVSSSTSDIRAAYRPLINP